MQVEAAVRGRLIAQGEATEMRECGASPDADAAKLGTGLAGHGAGDLATEAQVPADSGGLVAGADRDYCPGVVERCLRAGVVLVDLLQPVRVARARQG